MARVGYTDHEIKLKLSLVAQKYNQGLTIDEACRAVKIAKTTYFRWKKKHLEANVERNGF
jgi:transposase-like protein